MNINIKDFLAYIFSKPKIDNSRMQWVDLAKGIAITMIVYRHAITGMWDARIPMDILFYDISIQVGLTFRMPLYFLLSGIFFRRSIHKRGIKGYMIHKANTIMYPYFIWSVILMTLQMVFSDYVNGQFTTLQDWLTLFYDPWGHWWFLYTLFVVSILYMFIHHLFKGNKFIILSVSIALYFLSYGIGDLYLIDDIFELLIFFSLGDITASYAVSLEQNSLAQKKLFMGSIFILAALGEFLLFKYYRDSSLAILLFACIGIFAAALLCVHLAKSQLNIKKHLRMLGQHSLYIYLLHAFAAPAMRVFLNRILGIQELWILVPLCFMSGLLVPILVYRVINYFGGSFLFVLNLK